MGTNFYIIGYDSNDADNPSHHIGKRSAAGLYCWDCGITLAKEGESSIGSGRSIYKAFYHMVPKVMEDGNSFFDHCPKCGKKPSTSDDSLNAGLVELGFQTAAGKATRGVSTCSSFSWAMYPYLFWAKVAEFADDAECIVNEYGDLFTKQTFREEILKYCAIEKFIMIGERFS